MLSWFEHLLDGVNPNIAHVLIGLVVLLESMGIPLPGETILVAGAMMSAGHIGHLSPHAIAISGAAGAIVGDSLAYWIVREHGDKLLRWLHRRFPNHIKAIEVAWAGHIFRRYGFMAVFLGRFVALLRMFAGPLSGLMRMHYYTFLAANVLGGVLWSCLFTYGIYYAGVAAEHTLKSASWVALLVVIALAVTASLLMRRKMAQLMGAFERDHPDEVRDAERRLA